MIGRDMEVDVGDARLRLWAAPASGGLFRPLDTFKRLCHGYQQTTPCAVGCWPSLLRSWILPR
jgi:hypothetical protein